MYLSKSALNQATGIYKIIKLHHLSQVTSNNSPVENSSVIVIAFLELLIFSFLTGYHLLFCLHDMMMV